MEPGGGGPQASPLTAPLLGVPCNRAAADEGGRAQSSFGSESSHAQSGVSQECALGVSVSEFSTCILSSPKNAEADEAKSRGCAVAVSLEVPRIGNNAYDSASVGSGRRRSTKNGEPDLAVTVIRNMQMLLDRKEVFRQRKEAEDAGVRLADRSRRGTRITNRGSEISADMAALMQGQLQLEGQSGRSSVASTDNAGRAGEGPAGGTGEQPTDGPQPEVQAPVESEVHFAEERHQLSEERRQLTEERDMLAKERDAFLEERRQLAEDRERLAVHSQAMQQLQREFDASKQELELKSQQAAKSHAEIEQLRKELSAAKQQLEVQKEEDSLRPALAAAQSAQRSEAAQAAAAEAAKEQANVQTEILRVQCHVAEADLGRVKSELSEVITHKMVLEEELRHLRERAAPAAAAGNVMQGGPALMTRHELACRSNEKTQAVTAAEASSAVKSPSNWFSCCSSVEFQPSKPAQGSPRGHMSG